MRPCLQLAVSAVATVLSVSSAQAITIMDAEIDSGAVQVKGKDALPDATMTWENQTIGFGPIP